MVQLLELMNIIQFWEEIFEFRIPENNRLKISIYNEQLYPKYNPLISPIEIPKGKVGDHISYDGPIYNDDEEVGKFSYEIDFLPLEYSDEIVDKYNREMEAKRLEEEEQRELERQMMEAESKEEERRREETRRKEEERKRKEEEKKKEEKISPNRKWFLCLIGE